MMLTEKGVATEKKLNIALQRNTRWVSGFQRCGSVPVFKRHCCWEWIVHPAERTNQLGELDQKSPEYHQTSGNYVDDKTLGSCLKLVLCTSSFAIAILLRPGIFAHVFRLFPNFHVLTHFDPFGWWTLPISGAEAMQDHCRKGFEELRGETQGAPS